VEKLKTVEITCAWNPAVQFMVIQNAVQRSVTTSQLVITLPLSRKDVQKKLFGSAKQKSW
jgi:hypothetical protein